MIYKKNGKMQLTLKSEKRKEYEKPTEESLRRGEVRRQIEDIEERIRAKREDLW